MYISLNKRKKESYNKEIQGAGQSSGIKTQRTSQGCKMCVRDLVGWVARGDLRSILSILSSFHHSPLSFVSVTLYPYPSTPALTPPLPVIPIPHPISHPCFLSLPPRFSPTPKSLHFLPLPQITSNPPPLTPPQPSAQSPTPTLSLSLPHPTPTPFPRQQV